MTGISTFLAQGLYVKAFLFIELLKLRLKMVYNSYTNPIRVAPPVSSHEYSNASKLNPKIADFNS